MAKRYGWGIIGCGVIAPAHIKGVRENDDRAHVVGLYDLVLDRAKQYQAEFGVPFATDNLNDFLVPTNIITKQMCLIIHAP